MFRALSSVAQVDQCPMSLRPTVLDVLRKFCFERGALCDFHISSDSDYCRTP